MPTSAEAHNLSAREKALNRLLRKTAKARVVNKPRMTYSTTYSVARRGPLGKPNILGGIPFGGAGHLGEQEEGKGGAREGTVRLAQSPLLATAPLVRVSGSFRVAHRRHDEYALVTHATARTDIRPVHERGHLQAHASYTDHPPLRSSPVRWSCPST
ncbi:hypothetical protein MRX96_029244 [Rhipicephalus microplus]